MLTKLLPKLTYSLCTFHIHSCPHVSEITACQVLIGTFEREKQSINGASNKSEYEELLKEIERNANDPTVFIRDRAIGKHNRWFVKQRYWHTNKEKFQKNPYWFLTLTQLYIGLRPGQAR
jgi:hypothetical protein